MSVRGEVIGINSAIASETGFYSGYGFAIPINLARTVMNQLITDGKVHRAALGVSIADVTLNDAPTWACPRSAGVVVKDIPSDDSPAKAAGIEPGDIIVAVDGKPVEYVGQLQQIIGFRRPGDMVKVEVARKGGVRKSFNVKLQPLDDAPEVAAADEEGDSDNANSPTGAAMGRLGISVEPVTADVAQQLQLPADARGLIVTDVTPGGPAWDVLFDDPQRGGPDIILSVEGQAGPHRGRASEGAPGRESGEHRDPAGLQSPRAGAPGGADPAGRREVARSSSASAEGACLEGMPLRVRGSPHARPTAVCWGIPSRSSLSMTTSEETDWMNHPVIRRLVDQAATLALEERITLVKGLIPGIADALTEEEYEQFVTFIRLKGERFLEAKAHPGEGRAERHIPGDRDLEGR